MITIVPAAGLGLLFVFFAGAGVTYAILELATNRLTKGQREKLSLVGGGVTTVLIVVLMLQVPRELTTLIWYGLTVIGFIVGISTFFLFGSESNSRARTKQRPTYTQTSWRPERKRQKHQAEHQTRENEAQKMQRELEKERQKHQAEYQARVYEMQRKQAETEAIKNDLFSLFGISDDQSRKRGQLLQDVLHRFFNANDILVKEAFKLIEQTDEGIVEHIEGAIEVDRHLYLVEMRWQKEPLGTPEVSPHLVRVFNRGYSGGVVISNSRFSQPAITTCKEALSQKTVILCELEEIVILLEQSGDLESFLKAKIAAAVIDKNPLFKPLS